MRRLLLISAVSSVLAFGAFSQQPASAQSDSRMLYDRIERLERDLATMQAQSARGGGSMVRTAPSDGSVAGNMASRLETRLDELEDANRFLTGKLEEANFRIGQLNKQIERMQADIDLRFKDIQESGMAAKPGASGGSAPVSMAAPQAPATQPNGAPILTPPKGMGTGTNSADNPGPAPGPTTLGQLSVKDAKRAESQAATAPAPAAAPPLPKDPQAAYDQAYSQLQKGDFDGAERDFNAFLKANPSHNLAGNAHYWLGDIAFSQRKDFETAAKLFADGYKKFPKNQKAPDMLYKLGASFGQLDKKTEACKVYALLAQTHPDMSDRIKRAVAGEKQRLGCK